jgi:hypothetical protein
MLVGFSLACPCGSRGTMKGAGIVGVTHSNDLTSDLIEAT